MRFERRGDFGSENGRGRFGSSSSGGGRRFGGGGGGRRFGGGGSGGGRRFEDDRPKPIKAGEEYDVAVTETGSRGDGIARVKNFVVFIDGAKEGDKIKIEITDVRQRFALAKKISESSDEAIAECSAKCEDKSENKTDTESTEMKTEKNNEEVKIDSVNSTEEIKPNTEENKENM